MSAAGGPAVGVLLVHGYLGSPRDLAPLHDALALRWGTPAIESLRLPGHEDSAVAPPFDATALVAAVAAAMQRHTQAGRRLVAIGHSTGGALLLAALRQLATAGCGTESALALLVLCATPPLIDGGYVRRWSGLAHEAPPATGGAVPLHDLGSLVSLVNGLGRQAPLAVAAPVLIVHGDADELVPVESADAWQARLATGPRRIVRVPDAGHHLWQGRGTDFANDVIERAIGDAVGTDIGHADDLARLLPAPPAGAVRWPGTRRHLARSPAGRRALDLPFEAAVHADGEPTIANVEITTQCTLACIACARTQLKRRSRHMSMADFRRVLALLPHAQRIVLVGLGEPLLHPEVIGFIRLAVAEGRRVGLVTNAMPLDAAMARALCTSGLAGITFSIDAVTPERAERVRPGSDMERISANIRGLVQERSRTGLGPGTSAFTALARDTLDEFIHVVGFVADHGIDALMISDLNFAANRPRALGAAPDTEGEGSVRRALKRAAQRRLPVLTVRALEEFALETRFGAHLARGYAQLAERAPRHAHCLSPWQTVPVGVDGRVTACDCQPEAVIGNLLHEPLAAWWNGELMREQRRRMLGDDPPPACRVCPRF